MSGTRGYLLIAIAVIVIVLGLNSFTKIDHSRRNTEIFTEMVYSEAGESFTTSDVLPGGVTMQPLVGGVVVRGQMPFGYQAGTEEAQRAGRELASPFPAGDAPNVERGRDLYAIYCTVCHDPAGNGEGKATQRGMVRPPSLHAARATMMPDGEMFHILTLGQGNMASYAAQLSAEERWQVILHIRALQEQNK